MSPGGCHHIRRFFLGVGTSGGRFIGCTLTRAGFLVIAAYPGMLVGLVCDQSSSSMAKKGACESVRVIRFPRVLVATCRLFHVMASTRQHAGVCFQWICVCSTHTGHMAHGFAHGSFHVLVLSYNLSCFKDTSQNNRAFLFTCPAGCHRSLKHPLKSTPSPSESRMSGRLVT